MLLLDHPSLSGLTSGTGRGGNMDWWNAVRGVLLLRIPDEKAEADCGIRVLETGKSNYAQRGNPLRLVWTDGGLATERQPSSLHRLAKDAECDETFLRLLDERNAQGRHGRRKERRHLRPDDFRRAWRATAASRREAFAPAMDRLFKASKIALQQFGPPSRGSTRIERVAEAAK